MSSAPEILIGTGGFGATWFPENLDELSKAAKDAGIKRIDTAAIYPIHSPGLAERMIGEAGFSEKGFVMDSKIMYSIDGNGTLAYAAIEKSISQSLESLKIPKLNVLYVHGPDRETPISEQAANLDAQYQAGKFSHLGICNLSPEMLEEWLSVAAEKGYVKPSVYQGQYNLLSRTYEAKIFPLLRQHGMSFVAFSPLAGGFLTGKLTGSMGPADLEGTRFEVSDTNFMGMGFRHWYDKASMHAAIKKLQELCDPLKISTNDAAWRWILYHSVLTGQRGDGVIVGPRNLSQLANYVEGAKDGPLSNDLVKSLDELWDIVKEDAEAIIVY